MKAFKLMIVALCMVVGINNVSAQTKDSKETEVTFKVNMHCHSCEQKIKKNIPYEKGVKDMTTDLEKQQVVIKYRTDKTDKAKLQKAIEKLGYTCEEVDTTKVAATATTPSCCSKSAEGKSCGDKK